MAACDNLIESNCANPDDGFVDGPILDVTSTGGTLFKKLQKCKIDLDVYRYVQGCCRVI